MDGDFYFFIVGQFRGLSMLRGYKSLTSQSIEEYCRWIAKRSDGDEQKVRRFILELLETSKVLPVIQEMAEIWARVNASPKTLCDECSGQRYVPEERNGRIGYRPCPQCNAMPKAELPATASRATPKASPTIGRRRLRAVDETPFFFDEE